MHDFDDLIGEWRTTGEIPMDPPLRITGTTTIERLGAFVVIRSAGEPVEVPDSISIVGGAQDGQPQPMHYFDGRGVKRRYLTTVQGSTWTIRRAPQEDLNGPDGPGFDQRFIGEISADGTSIAARWERRLPDGGWEIDFPIDYVRIERTSATNE